MKKKTDKKDNDYFAAPFGVTRQGNILRFAVSVPHAEECILKLFKTGCQEAIATIPLDYSKRIGSVFLTEVDNHKLKADSYLYLASGKEFVDFYAKKVIGREIFGRYLSKEERKQVRGSWNISKFSWDEDKPPLISFTDMVLYKLHVRGFTKQAGMDVKHKGTYLGIIEKVSYLKELGINAVLLMPCVEFNEILEEEQTGYGMPNRYVKDLEEKKQNEICEETPKYRVNYWGYSDDNYYFAPKASYASKPSEASKEFKHMVKCLHGHGIEVLMEMNFAKSVTQLQMLDCLRYWVLEYHIDGFRIDTSRLSENLVTEDPLLTNTKLIAAGWNRNQIPFPLSSSNIRLASYHNGFQTNARMFLKGDDNKVSSFLESTSSGVKQYSDRTCQPGIINYFTENNGFTLMDVYSYDIKHNEENGEENRDGTNYNYSWNCGIEGSTRKKTVNALRLKMRKNAMAALLLSQGTPMILAGDEFGNSQYGNNNAYCQDNQVGWIDWKAKRSQGELYLFVKQMIELRKSHRILHYPTEFKRMDYISCGCPDISFHGLKAWYPNFNYKSHELGIMLCGRYAECIDNQVDDDFYIIYNMHWESQWFDLPSMNTDTHWELLISTEANENMKTTKIYNENDKESSKEYNNIELKKSKKENNKQYFMPPRSIAIFINKRKKGMDIKSAKTDMRCTNETILS